MTASAPHPEIVPISLPTPFPIGPVNAFLLRGEALVLVDTGPGTDAAYEVMARTFREQQVAISDVEAILVTHGHVDHVGLLGRLVEESGAKVYAHPYALISAARQEAWEKRFRGFIYDALQRFGAPPPILEATRKARDEVKSMASQVTADHILHHGDKALGFDVHHVPGHSASDTLLYDPARRLAFTGDHVLRRVTPSPLLRPSRETGERVRSLPEYVNSLRHTYDLDIQMCYPGHGEPFSGHREIIENAFTRLEKRTGKVRALLSENPMTPYEVCMSLFPQIDEANTYVGIAVALGHLDVLEDRGEVVAQSRGSVVYYSLTESGA
ncbi:MAG: MBL fold metallo-hydrolase [Candidatus Hydrogenedentes bacterium]|nr:MBL fold metallo-hydrolase [Candidatus Hydrogenedentota bacterium]